MDSKSQEGKEVKNDRDHRPNAFKLIKPNVEWMLDLADFADHVTAFIPIQCGFKIGRVFVFSHVDHLSEEMFEYYKGILKNAIEAKKYYVSMRVGRDVGPTVAIAELIEDGDYERMIKIFETEKLKLKGLEHVLLVEEEGKFHHLMLAEDVLAFANYEQFGLVRYSLYSALEKEVEKKVDEVARKVLMEWLQDRGQLTFKLFREILEKQRVYQLDKDVRERYGRCVIFENLFDEILRRKDFWSLGTETGT